MQIRQATDDPGLAIENSFLFGRHADPNLELHDVELWRVSAIAVSMIGLTLICVFIAWRRGTASQAILVDPTGADSRCCPALAVPLLSADLEHPAQAAFPPIPLALARRARSAARHLFCRSHLADKALVARRSHRCDTAIFLSITAVTALVLHQPCDAEDKVVGMLGAFRSGQDFQGTDEYAPPGADNSLVAIGLPDACLTINPAVVLAKADDGNTPEWDPANGHCDATYQWIRHKGQLAPEHFHLTANTPHAGYLVLHLRNYAAWRVAVNGEVVALGSSPLYASLPHRDDGLMVVPVPEGPVRVDVDWTITGDVIMGRLLSLISFGCITVLCLIERKLASARRVNAEPRVS